MTWKNKGLSESVNPEDIKTKITDSKQNISVAFSSMKASIENFSVR